MKKSEVIKSLATYLKGTSAVHPEVYAKDILEFLIREGMLPDLNDNRYCYMDNDDRRLWHQVRDWFTWEDEDV